MTRNIERRQFKRTPLSHEIEALTYIVDKSQKDHIKLKSLSNIRNQEFEDPQGFLREISPMFKTVESIQ